MSDKTLTAISDIKSRLHKIREKLFEIPKQREIKCFFEQIGFNPSKFIYKPRFSPKQKLIPQDIRVEFLKIIDDINLYLLPYSPDNLSNLRDILNISSENKNSLIYLLENDVYQTDDVYGDYLVELNGDHYEVNYFRRDKKIQRLPNQPLSIVLEEFIIKDAIHQIQNQFDQLWIIIENEMERCENRYISQQKMQDEERVSLISQTLDMKECEYLDFKLEMYQINSIDQKIRIIHRKEFLKDVLGLINNKKLEENFGRAYIIIGVGEKNGIFNRVHKSIDFYENQILRQLINEFITPHVDLEIDEYFIFIENDEPIIMVNKFENSDRILMLTFFYKVGTVYELKKRIGNSTLKVNFYHEGTSFIRDGSHTRRITQQDRELIMDLLSEFEEFEKSQYNKELTKIDFEMINRYLELIEKGEIANDMIHDALGSIQNELTRIRYKAKLEEIDLITVEKTCVILQDFMKDKTLNIRRRIVYALSPLVHNDQTLKIFKNKWFNYLKKLYKKGEYFPDLIRYLDFFGFFKNIETLLNEIIDRKNDKLLDLYGTYIDFSKFRQDRFKIIEMLNKKLKNLDPDDQNITKIILRIIRKVQ